MAKKHTFDYDLIVIGSGAAGSAAATIAARAKKRVAIIEAETFGGDSPNFGDVPWHALMQAAKVYDAAKHSAQFGLRTNTLGYNYPSLRNWKNLAVKRTGTSNNKRFYESQGVKAITGRAHFLTPHEITVNRRHLSAAKFLIATGATWTKPAIQGLDKIAHHSPRTILEIMRPPKSLFVIGGGKTGVQIAELMAIFGSKVYIGEIAERLLPKFDQDIGRSLENTLNQQKGVISLTQSRVVAVQKDGLAKRVVFNRAGVEKHVRVDEIVVATGKTPNLDLGLENALIEFSANGIKVNDFLQTNVRHIFAAGAVIDPRINTHTALLQSRVAAHNLFSHNQIEPDYKANPEIIFTQPEIAQAGLSEDDCTRRDLKIKTAKVPLSIVARSNTSDFYDGFVKLIANKKGVLLGAAVVAPGASETIHQPALAIRHGLTVQDLATMPHAFLSWSEAIRVAASQLCK